jgi:hypothetical protein
MVRSSPKDTQRIRKKPQRKKIWEYVIDRRGCRHVVYLQPLHPSETTLV